MPRPPCARSSVVSSCVKRSKMPSSIGAGMPRPVSVTRNTTWPSSPRSRRSRCVPPGGVYLAALLSRLAITCAMRAEVAAHVQGSRGRRHRELVAALLDQRPAGLHGGREDGADVDVLGAQLDLAAGDARDVEQVVDDAHQLRDWRSMTSRAHGQRVLVGARSRAAPRSRCGWAPAGCAARARASPGTRPCGGRCRAPAGRAARCRARCRRARRAPRPAPARRA